MSLLLWVPPLVVLVMVVVNRLTWRRPRDEARLPGPVSVLVPARNEADNIDACLEALGDSAHPIAEILVWDDGSTDDTAARVAAQAQRDPRVVLLAGGALPAGWVGKAHACHQLASRARGEFLLFVDADVRFDRGGLGRLATVLGPARPHRVDVVTAFPRQETVSFAEEILLPLLALTYTAWLPLLLVARLRSPRVLAANGQVLLVRRSCYDRVGGFAAVRAEVVDDMAFCREVKRTGGVVDFVDGALVASCRMYRSGAEVRAGFAKNLYEGIGASTVRLGLVIALHLLCFVAPYAFLLGGLLFGIGPVGAAAAGVGLNLTLRLVLARRHGHTLRSVLLHPVAVLGLLGIALSSWWWSARGRIAWRGRAYPARAARGLG